jgi:hypothetical protein
MPKKPKPVKPAAVRKHVFKLPVPPNHPALLAPPVEAVHEPIPADVAKVLPLEASGTVKVPCTATLNQGWTGSYIVIAADEDCNLPAISEDGTRCVVTFEPPSGAGEPPVPYN